MCMCAYASASVLDLDSNRVFLLQPAYPHYASLIHCVVFRVLRNFSEYDLSVLINALIAREGGPSAGGPRRLYGTTVWPCP